MLSLPHATLYFGICVYGVFVSTVAVLVYVCKHAGLGSLSKLACLALRGFGLWSASVWVASGTRVRCARVMDEATRFAAWTKEGPSLGNTWTCYFSAPHPPAQARKYVHV